MAEVITNCKVLTIQPWNKEAQIHYRGHFLSPLPPALRSVESITSATIEFKEVVP